MLFSRFEKLLLVSFFVAAVLSLLFYFRFQARAFPEDTIHFSISSTQSSVRAAKFLRQLGISVSGYKQATIFTIDDAAKTYMEREDTSQVVQLSADIVALWGFSTRFFQPFQQQEYTVNFLPNGRLSSYTRVLPENVAKNTVSQQVAQTIAEQFLQQQLHRSLSEWSLVDSNSQKFPKRIDYAFTWERKNFRVHDATYRMEVGVQGNEVGSYSEYLHVPESWQRSYAKERSQNDLAETIASVFALLFFGISSFLFFLFALRKASLRFRLGTVVGLVLFIISFLAAINSLPSILYSYDTTQSWTAFLVEVVVGAAGQSILPALISGFIVVIGEYVYRLTFPNAIALEALFSGKGLQTKSGTYGLLLGSLYGIISFGYVTAFYILGAHFGVWSPADVNYTDAYSTFLPWLYPLYIGLSAAVLEEGIFRLFGIVFLKRFVKQSWIAILITAFSWSFLHSNYPQSPWFIRGIEVGIEGIILGALYVRFGIIASFAAHYTFDALTTAVSFFSQPHLIDSMISVVLSLLFLLFGVVFLIKGYVRKGFLSEVGLTNHFVADRLQRHTAPPKKIHTSEKGPLLSTYVSVLSARVVIVLCLAVVLSFCVFGFVSMHLPLPVTPAQTLTRDAALAKARTIMQDEHISPTGYYAVASFISTPPSDLEQKYILQHSSLATLNTIYPRVIPTNFWYIRFFKPLQPNEYHVWLLPSGEVYSFNTLLSDDTAGKNLSKQQALQIATQYLKHEKHIPLQTHTLVDSSVEKKVKRTDYSFTFEARKRIGDARFRISLSVVGDRPSDFNSSIKLPEDWVRAQEKTTTWDVLFTIVPIILFLVLVGYLIGMFFVEVKRQGFAYKRVFLFSLPLLVLWLLGTGNKLSMFFSGYDTSLPISTFVIEAVIGMFVSFIILGLFVPLLIAFFWRVWGRFVGPAFPETGESRKQYVRDALFLGYVLPIIVLGLSSGVAYVSISSGIDSSPFTADSLSGIDTFFPAFSAFSPLLSGFLLGMVLILFVLVLKKLLRTQYVLLGVLLLGSIVFSVRDAWSSTHVLSLLALHAGLSLFSTAFILSIIFRITKTNLLTYFLLFYTTVLFTQALSLWDTNVFFRVNSILLFLLGILPLLLYFWYFFFWVKRRKHSAV